MIWHRHKWTDWNVTDEGSVMIYGVLRGRYMIQQRHCLACGKTQIGQQATARHEYFESRKSDFQDRKPRKEFA